MNENNKKDIYDEILRSLSFLDFLNKEKIIMGMDQELLELSPDFTNEDLEKILNEFERKKIIKTKKSKKGEILYRKELPQRSLWQRVKLLFRR